jgi:glycine/D-amino acid oxidase-like deaminating enzyme
MLLKSGYPFSLIKYGLPFDYPKLETNLETDVLIMGGGISGALVAHALVKENIDNIVVDARTIGLGSTCASTSLLQYEIDTPLHKLIPMAGYQHAVRAYRLCADSIHQVKEVCHLTGLKDFEFKPSLYYAAHKKDIPFLQKEFQARRQAGFDVRYLDENDLYKQYGFRAAGAIRSAIAATVDAYLLTHYIHQYNLEKGSKVYDRTTLQTIRHTSRGVQVKTKNGQIIQARKLVYAPGYEVVNYIDQPIVKLHSTYACISESLNPDHKPWNEDAVLWNTADPYLYMRTTPDHRIIIGGRDEEFYSPAKRDKLIVSKSKQLTRDFKKIFPGIPFVPEFSWTGTFGSTQDGLPYIGPYHKLSNSYFALGFGGNGITFSQVAATIIAGLLKGRKNKDLEIFSFDRSR